MVGVLIHLMLDKQTFVYQWRLAECGRLGQLPIILRYYFSIHIPLFIEHLYLTLHKFNVVIMLLHETPTRDYLINCVPQLFPIYRNSK